MIFNKKVVVGSVGAAAIVLLGSTAAFAATTQSSTATASAPHHRVHGQWTGNHHMHGGMGARLSTLAADLKLSTTTLRSDLKAGKTISAIASAQGVSTSVLIADLESARAKQLTSLVTAGKITTAQETAMLKRVDQRITDMVNGTAPTVSAKGMPGMSPMAGGWSGGHFHHGDGMGPRGGFGMMSMKSGLTAVAGDLHLTTSALQADLKAGHTLASLATAQNVSVTTVVDALDASPIKQINSMVTAGKLTSAQAQTMESRTVQMITNFVNGTMPTWHRGGSQGSGATASGSTGSTGNSSNAGNTGSGQPA